MCFFGPPKQKCVMQITHNDLAIRDNCLVGLYSGIVADDYGSLCQKRIHTNNGTNDYYYFGGLHRASAAILETHRRSSAFHRPQTIDKSIATESELNAHSQQRSRRQICYVDEYPPALQRWQRMTSIPIILLFLLFAAPNHDMVNNKWTYGTGCTIRLTAHSYINSSIRWTDFHYYYYVLFFFFPFVCANMPHTIRKCGRISTIIMKSENRAHSL